MPPDVAAPTMRPWSLRELGVVAALRDAHADLGVIALTTGRPRGACDRALWALLGRSPEAALAALTASEPAAAAPTPSPPPPPRRGLKRFLEGMFR